ncbi:coiled-coil domain-containing protein [Magnetococcales bacterium HHB-1]
MGNLTFDTLAFAKRLQQSGFSEQQAEALSGAVRDANQTQFENVVVKEELTLFESVIKKEIKIELKEILATKEDITEVKRSINVLAADMVAQKSELQSEISTQKAELQSNIDNLKVELKSDMADLKTEFKGEMSALEKGLKDDMADLKTELKGDMSALKAEFKSDMADLKTELKGDMADFKVEVKSDLADLKVDVIKWIVSLLLAQTTLIIASFFAMLRFLSP